MGRLDNARCCIHIAASPTAINIDIGRTCSDRASIGQAWGRQRHARRGAWGIRGREEGIRRGIRRDLRRKPKCRVVRTLSRRRVQRGLVVLTARRNVVLTARLKVDVQACKATCCRVSAARRRLHLAGPGIQRREVDAARRRRRRRRRPQGGRGGPTTVDKQREGGMRGKIAIYKRGQGARAQFQRLQSVWTRNIVPRVWMVRCYGEMVDAGWWYGEILWWDRECMARWWMMRCYGEMVDGDMLWRDAMARKKVDSVCESCG